MKNIPEARKLIHTAQGRQWLEQFEDIDKHMATAVAAISRIMAL